MKTQWNNWTKLIPWLIAVLLSSAGMFLGYELGSGMARLLGGEPGIWARMGKGFVWGGVITGLQWSVIRSVGVRPLLLMVTGVVSFAVGYPLGQTIQSIFIHHWNLHLTGYWLAVATFGLSLGVPQSLIFRRHLKRSGLWILLSLTGWILTGLVWLS
jgi:hypothetical protein